MLEVRDVAKSYDRVVALDGVSLNIAAGEILGFLGPNGAGKTTLISIVAGLLRPDRGSMQVGGLDVQAEPMKVRHLLGVAPQELGLYAQLSVRKNLRFFGRLAGLGRDELEERIEEVATALDLVLLFGRRARDLSGGEKRRVHTAVALLPRAPLLLLDEPTAGADVHTRNRLLDVVKRLARGGTAVCYATHYLREVESLGAGVAILERGRVIAKGSVDELTAASGGAVIEICMNGPVPEELADRGNVDQDHSTLRIPAADPGAALVDVMASIGRSAGQIRSVEIVQPSLESAYLALTGRRFDVGKDRQDK